MSKLTGFHPARFGFYISIITSLLATVTFLIALCTPPLSGPFCQEGCFSYPYTDIIERFPRDYYWMFPAIILSFMYMVMIIVIGHVTSGDKKLFSQISTAFAIISTIILSLDYFIQVSFVQQSLLAGETGGIAVLSQYNPHGLFIILEELGFIAMNISFFCLIPVFSAENRIEKAIRVIFITGFILMIGGFALVTALSGIKREYFFELIIITITWTGLIASGILITVFFRKLYKSS